MNRDNKHNPLYISMLFRFFINSFEFVGCIRFGLMDGSRSMSFHAQTIFVVFYYFFGGREKANTQQKRLRTVGFLLLLAVGSVQTLCASVYWRESVVGTRSMQI